MPADPPVVLGPEQPWKRLLAMIAFGAIGYVLLPLLLLLAVVQFGFHLWADRSNERITQLADAMKALLGSILDFLLYRSDHLPFPFNPFPESSVPGERFAFSPDLGATDADTDVPSAWQACLRHLSGCHAASPTPFGRMTRKRWSQSEFAPGSWKARHTSRLLPATPN